MDEKLRNLERRAKEGDLEAATQWMMEVSRTGDTVAWLEAAKLVGELQYPGIFETLKMLKETEKLIQMPPVEGGYWSTEIVMNTGP